MEIVDNRKLMWEKFICLVDLIIVSLTLKLIDCCSVKTTTMKNLFIALLLSIGSFGLNAQTITVQTPNGGEVLYACQSYTISWSTSGTLSNYYDIHYSLDGGTIWASIASNYLSLNGQYSWTVPQVQSTTCLVRVRDAQNTTILDISDAHFTINIPVTVLAPNGGEVLQGGQVYPITWNAQGTSNSFTIHYSLNGGSTWTTIVSNFSTMSGTYNWTVPNNPSTNVLVRVRDAVTSCMVDQSDAPFTIIPADPILTAPNGGEVWYPGCSYNITWNTATFYSTVNLEYSVDEGINWITIATNRPNTGTHTWAIPFNVSPTCLVRASNSANTSIHDVSDATFEIGQPIQVVTPNGGQTFYGCSSYPITWTKPSNCIAQFTVQYSLDNGANWITIATPNNSGSGNTQTLNWSVPNEITSNQALVRVFNSAQPTWQDQSDNTFNIAPSNDITVTSPNGGEVLQALTTAVISWTNLPSASGLYNIHYSVNGGSSFITVASSITGNNFIWNVPNNPSTNCIIRVTDASNTCKFDWSDNTFTIEAAQPVLLSPNGGEILDAGCATNITWNTATFHTTVRIDYSSDNGFTWNNIITNAANTGTRSWTPPHIYSTQYLIKVANSSNLLVTDESDAVFTVRNPIKVVYLNGGENLNACANHTIVWEKPGSCIAQFRVEYSLDNGATWILIGTPNNSGTGNTQSLSWSLPYHFSSSTALVRVSNNSQQSVHDVADAVFNVIPTSGIEVLTPNGGETALGCSSLDITWTKPSNCIARFRIEYSLNNGSTWVSLSTPFNSGTGNTQSHSWNVPNTLSSAEALIRVSDFDLPATSDVSNAVFTLSPSNHITVTSPNGGEVLTALTNHTIIWTNTSSVSGLFTLSYSTNGGSTWTNIATSITGNAHIWNVPNIPSSNCLIRVVDSGSSCIVDQSDAAFTIDPPLPVLLYPNGGEVLNAGCAMNITWDPAVFYSTVRIDYSTDGGLTWTNIITNATNNGSRSWTPPHVYSNQYLIKVANTTNVLIADTSNAPFTVKNPIEVVSPNGGETLIGCNSQTITWTKPGSCIAQFRVQYSIDNGDTWSNISTPTNVGSGNTQTVNWNVPNEINTSGALIRVSNFSDATVFDLSDANFSLIPSNDITVTSPNGGETLTALTTHTITWTNLPTVSGLYTLTYSTNGGSSWSTIASGISGNAFIWDVPNIPSSNCLVRVRDAGNSCVVDQSDAVFSIAPPLPVLLYPNGGEVLNAGCAVNITWDPTVFYSTVRIDYSTDGGLTWTNIITNATNTGSRSWTPPFVYSDQYLIKVANSDNVLVADTSNSTFTVRNPIEVVSPNGGEAFLGCETYTITWTKPGSCISQFRVQYSVDNGATWVNISTPLNSGSGNTQSLNWAISNSLSAEDVLIRVSNFSNGDVFDVSDANFSIQQPLNAITVTSPNGGETLTALTTHTITWTNLPSVSGLYNLSYSTNGGTSWTTIVNNVTGNAYTWSVPNVPSTSCLVRVRDSGSSCYVDDSDAFFTIAPLLPVLLSPNGGEVLNAGCPVNITWDPATFYSTVRIDYSSDGGLTWINIISNATNNGTRSWTPPYVYSDQFLIKIANSSNVLIADTSDATFTVKNPIELISPNGGEVFFGCTTYPITWSKPGGCITQFRVEYSFDNGLTWVNIATPTNVGSGNTQSVNWNISSAWNSENALIRVSNFNESGVFDVSDANFSIQQLTNAVTVTSPNGGGVYQGLGQTTITWTNTADASGLYTIRYSTNGGSTWTTIASNVTGNAYIWDIPNIPSNNYRIRIQDSQSSCIVDDSNADFIVQPANPVVLTPNGGESFYAGTNTTITWDPTTYYSNVRIEYSFDNGFTWNNIVTNAANNGSYTWSVPNVSSNLCLVKVSNTANVNVHDVSDNVFTIKPAVTIITPNGADGITTWGGCTVTSITFDHTPAYNRWDIDYSINGGATWINIVTNWLQSANPATFNWNIPNLNSDNVLVRVRPNLNPAWLDVSDAPFAITKPVTIIQPNFGGIMQVGSIYNITWSSDGISNIYDIFFSDNGGSTWSTVVLGYVTSNNTYAWTVPNAPSTNCLIRVRDNIDHCKEDVSDIPFTISNVAPALSVVSPNGGENLLGCSNSLISWAEASPHGLYDLYYSTNSGLSWNVIEEGYVSATTNYNWVVPNVNSSHVLVKVRANGTAIEDLSDALFTIQQSNLQIITNDAVICPGTSVQLEATGAPSYSWTPAAGLSNTGIANPIASPTETTTYVATYTNGGCVLQDEVTLSINPVGAVPVQVSISVTPSAVICAGNPVTFLATAENEGSTPAYQWLINGVPTGTNSPTFSVSTLSDEDEVQVVLTSSEQCVTNNPATSNTVVMQVSDFSAPSVHIVASSMSICDGQEVTFTATPVNGGVSPNYQWIVGGLLQVGNSNQFTTSSISSNDEIHVVMTSNSACAIGGPVTSNVLTIDVNTVPAQPGMIIGNTSVCGELVQNYSIAPVGGATSYTWTFPSGWVGNSVSESLNVLPGSTGGLVSVIANNGCGSSIQQSLPVAIFPAANVTANATATSICQGESVILSGTGGVSYSWTGGVSNGMSFVPGFTSSYTVTGTDANGCTDTDMITVTVLSSPNVTANASSTTICQGSAVTLSGGGAVSYVWNNGVTNSVSFVPPTTQTYTVTGTAANGCTATGQVTIQVNNLPAVSAGPNLTVCENSSITLSGTGAVNYTWNNGVVDNVPFFATNSGLYTVTGTDANGCSNTSSMNLTVNNLPSVGVSASNASVCLGGSVVLSGTGATSYSWTHGVMDGVAFAPTSTQTYQVTGSAANGCTATAQITIPVNTLPAITASSTATSVCPGEAITLTGEGGASYAWSHGVVNGVPFVPIATQTYVVTGTDANGCASTSQVTVVVNELPNVSAGINQTVCENSLVTLSASGAMSYSWDNGVVNNVPFNATNSGVYTVTGTDVNGCSNTSSMNLTISNLPTVGITASSTGVCAGESVTLSGTGAVSYNWSDGVVNGVAFVPTGTTTYHLVGEGANGCQGTAQVTIQVNNATGIAANASQTVLCEGDEVTLTGSGAISYTWSHGVLDGVSFIPVETQTYMVTGTDANGCTATAQVLVSVHSLPAIVAGSDIVVCANQSVTLNAAGGVSYSWNNGVVNGVPFVPATSGVYTVQGTGTNGCVGTDNVLITVHALPNVLANASSTALCQGQALTLTGSGATTYTWNLGVMDGVSFVPSSTQTYTVSATDANGCSNSAQVTVDVNALPVVGVNASSTIICQGEQVILSGTGAQLYTWDNGVVDGVGFAPSATQTYTVTGTSLSGCSNSTQVTVVVENAPVVVSSGGGTICEGESIGLSASGATLYSWNNGAGSGSSVTVSPTESIIYTVTGTSLNGCTSTNQVAVIVTPAPALTISNDASICVGASVELSVSGATDYSWSHGLGSGSLVNVSPATTTVYSVTGTNGDCSATAQVTVTVNQLPELSATGTSPICQGEVAELTANGASNYSWNNGGGSGAVVSVSPSATTTYQVTGVDGNGCSNSAQVTILVNSAPTPVATVNEDVVQTGNYVTYQWYVNNSPIPGATSQTWQFAENGNYYVVVTDGNGCSGTSATTSVTTAKIEGQDKLMFQIYPNPTNGEFTINFGQEVQLAEVRIINALGQLVEIQKGITASTYSTSLEGREPGIYFVEISAQGWTKVERIVKQ